MIAAIAIFPAGPNRRFTILAELLRQTYRAQGPTDFGAIFARTYLALGLSEEDATPDLYPAASLAIRSGLILCNRNDHIRKEITFASDTTFEASAALIKFARGSYYEGEGDAA